MKNSDLQKTVENAIRKAVREDLRERMPKDFNGLYYGTLLNMTAKFTWYNKYLLRQIVVFEIFNSFPLQLKEDDVEKLNAIRQKAGQDLNESNRERNKYNLGDSDNV